MLSWKSLRRNMKMQRRDRETNPGGMGSGGWKEMTVKRFVHLFIRLPLRWTIYVVLGAMTFYIWLPMLILGFIEDKE